MPNLDGGHYFLTALAPIHSDPCEGTGGVITSPTAVVREVLATLPTAAQSQVCAQSGQQSPFARCHRTHFARLVVIDQPAFNGRMPGHSLIESIRKTDLLAHGPVDRLTRSWVLLAIDFDPADDGLDGYLAGLWDVMADELRAVYSHCYEFTNTVRDRGGFARYIQRCQVETTMPFNDYWIAAPPLPSISLAKIGIAAAAFVAIVTVLWFQIGRGAGLAALIAAIAAAIYGAYRFILARGLKPFPTAPGSDLRTVLKALFLQQRFAEFAIANQGASPEALHAAFGTFVAANQPANVGQPTQAPGVIRS